MPAKVTPASFIPDYQEWYIPLTRRVLIEELITSGEYGASESDVRRLRLLAAELDIAVSIKYHNVLHDLKRFYDPVNPDKEANITAPDIGKTELKDADIAVHETRLLTLLRKVLKEANFQQLSHVGMMKVLEEHNVGEGVIVSVNPANYATLCFWVLGRHTKKTGEPRDWMESVYNRYKALTGRVMPKEQELYSRVVLAVRSKGQKSLRLKGYKDVPVGGLEQLLPDGKVRMRSFDRNLLISMCLIGSGSMAMRTTTQLSSMNIKSGSLIALIISGMIGLNSYFAYGNRKNSYLLELSEMHYYKNIANNLALVTLLIDRVQDEIFKEALLVYTRLLNGAQDGMQLVQLEKLVESWCKTQFSQAIEFDSRDAIELLTEIKFVARKGHLIHAKDLNEIADASAVTSHRYFDI